LLSPFKFLDIRSENPAAAVVLILLPGTAVKPVRKMEARAVVKKGLKRET
jgi:hypothetical protein